MGSKHLILKRWMKWSKLETKSYCQILNSMSKDTSKTTISLKFLLLNLRNLETYSEKEFSNHKIKKKKMVNKATEQQLIRI